MNTRIQRFAKFFRILFLIILILMPVLTAISWLPGGEITFEDGDSINVIEIHEGEVDIPEELAPSFPLPTTTMLMGLTICMLTTGVGSLALFWLVRLFGCFERGEYFTSNTAKYVRLLGWTMIVGVIAQPIHDILFSMVMTMHKAPDGQYMYLSLESLRVGEMLAAGVIILVSWIVDDASKLRETTIEFTT